MKILVMGGTQFNGLALVHELVAQGHEVTILNRGKTEASLPDGLHRLYGDRTDHDHMREVFADLRFDAIYDISAYHLEDVQLMHEIFRDRTDHYIFASSTVIYGASGTVPIAEHFPLERNGHQIEYGRDKIICEDWLFEQHADHGFPVSIVAFSMVFGPRNILPDREQRMFMRLLAGRPILIPGDGSTLIQFGFVEDQARALAELADKTAGHGQRFNLTGDQFVSDRAYVETIAGVLGVEPNVVEIPSEVMNAMWVGDLVFGGKPKPKTTGAHIDIRMSEQAQRERVAVISKFRTSTLTQRLAPNIHNWNSSVLFSIEKLRSVIDWKPQHTVESMADKTYGWFRDEGLEATLDFDWSFEDGILEHLGKS